jgi:hypothetical protein
LTTRTEAWATWATRTTWATWATAIARRGSTVRPTAEAVGTSRAVSRAALPGPAARATRSSALSRSASLPHRLHLLEQLRQFGPIELAVAIGVEPHRLLDHPLGRRRAAVVAQRASPFPWAAPITTKVAAGRAPPLPAARPLWRSPLAPLRLGDDGGGDRQCGGCGGTRESDCMRHDMAP